MDIKSPAKPTKSKQVELPKTEVSLSQAQTAKHFYLITSLILAVIILGGGFGIYKLLTAYTHKDNEIKAQNKLMNSLSEKIENLEALKAPYAEITDSKGGTGSKADAILRALPTTDNWTALVAMMDNIANLSSVTMLSVSKAGATGSTTSSSTTATPAETSPSGSSTTPQSKSLVFTIEVEGKYDNIIKFLENTEKSSRVINFKSMKISPGEENIKASLTMETYYQDEANIDPTYEELK